MQGSVCEHPSLHSGSILSGCASLMWIRTVTAQFWVPLWMVPTHAHEYVYWVKRRNKWWRCWTWNHVVNWDNSQKCFPDSDTNSSQKRWLLPVCALLCGTEPSYCQESKLWLCMGLRWINVFVLGLSTFNYIESISSPYNDFHWPCGNLFLMKPETYSTFGLAAFFALHLNRRIITVCTASLKKCCREINTDLQLLLHCRRQTWWRHKALLLSTAQWTLSSAWHVFTQFPGCAETLDAQAHNKHPPA